MVLFPNCLLFACKTKVKIGITSQVIEVLTPWRDPFNNISGIYLHILVILLWWWCKIFQDVDSFTDLLVIVLTIET